MFKHCGRAKTRGKEDVNQQVGIEKKETLKRTTQLIRCDAQHTGTPTDDWRITSSETGSVKGEYFRITCLV